MLHRPRGTPRSTAPTASVPGTRHATNPTPHEPNRQPTRNRRTETSRGVRAPPTTPPAQPPDAATRPRADAAEHRAHHRPTPRPRPPTRRTCPHHAHRGVTATRAADDDRSGSRAGDHGSSSPVTGSKSASSSIRNATCSPRWWCVTAVAISTRSRSRAGAERHRDPAGDKVELGDLGPDRAVGREGHPRRPENDDHERAHVPGERASPGTAAERRVHQPEAVCVGFDQCGEGRRVTGARGRHQVRRSLVHVERRADLDHPPVVEHQSRSGSDIASTGSLVATNVVTP